MTTSYTVHNGNSAQVLKGLEPNSIEAVVTDPPYGLGDMSPARVADCLAAWARGEPWTPAAGAKGFMGKEWDAWVPGPEVWREVYRVLKPGGHAIVFAGSRTQDLMSVALRLAGFEVRDTLMWLYGSGFPKSLDISKAIDKRGGTLPAFSQFRDALREAMSRTGMTRAALTTRLGNQMLSHYLTHGVQPATPSRADYLVLREALQLGDTWDHLFLSAAEREVIGQVRSTDPVAWYQDRETVPHEYNITAPHTDNARTWQGWGTQLKPAYEPAILARKPPEGTVAQNTLTHGCGGLNIDGCRVGEELVTTHGRGTMGVAPPIVPLDPDYQGATRQGRWPANILLDSHAAEALDSHTGTLRTGARAANRYTSHEGTTYGKYKGGVERELHASEGGASRFFYTAKASRSEREAGLDGRQTRRPSAVFDAEHTTMLTGAGNPRTTQRANHHPTVKPLELMRYLVRLITPPGATVLDPFTGSGSTGCAAVMEGAHFVGVELDPEYAEIARTRIAHWAQQAPAPQEHEPQEHEPQEHAPPAPEPQEHAPQEDAPRGGKDSPQLSLL